MITMIGDGTESNPYQVVTRDDIITIAGSTSYWNKYFILMNDISLSEGSPANPIGNSTTKFSGTFDGQGHTISDFEMNKPGVDNVGFFGYLEGGEINNMGIEAGPSGVSGDDYVGILVGHNYSTITNCYTTGNVTGTNRYTGGLVGSNSGSVTNCYATGDITGSRYTGGFVGYNFEGTITNCFATGNIYGNIYPGGFIGKNYGSSSFIINCYRYNSSGTDGILITDITKFKTYSWLTGTTPDDGLKWSTDIISNFEDLSKIWRVFSDNSSYPVFQFIPKEIIIKPGISFSSANMMVI